MNQELWNGMTEPWTAPDMSNGPATMCDLVVLSRKSLYFFIINPITTISAVYTTKPNEIKHTNDEDDMTNFSSASQYCRDRFTHIPIIDGRQNLIFITCHMNLWFKHCFIYLDTNLSQLGNTTVCHWFSIPVINQHSFNTTLIPEILIEVIYNQYISANEPFEFHKLHYKPSVHNL